MVTRSHQFTTPSLSSVLLADRSVMKITNPSDLRRHARCEINHTGRVASGASAGVPLTVGLAVALDAGRAGLLTVAAVLPVHGLRPVRSAAPRTLRAAAVDTPAGRAHASAGRLLADPPTAARRALVRQLDLQRQLAPVDVGRPGREPVPAATGQRPRHQRLAHGPSSSSSGQVTTGPSWLKSSTP